MSNVITPDSKLTVAEGSIGDYFALLKPKVMSLVIFTGFVGMWIAPGMGDIHPFLLLVGMLCLSLNAGAAGAINMWFDRDIDSIMSRTKTRPIPMGRIDPDDALGFGLILSILSVMIMGLALNWTAAGILAFANIFYVVIYTMWLKRSTPQNIVIGGAAGAFPPMIGWAMVTGDVTMLPLLMFLIIFFWTPPHFWALCLFANEDYKRADIPMMSVVAGAKSTKRQMLGYSLVLFGIAVAPTFLGLASIAYGVSATILSGFFVYTAIRVLGSEDLKPAKLMFGYSVFYLFALFTAFMVL
ncbi:MAG: heme o synthase [Alphaproteobacteria bacterium]